MGSFTADKFACAALEHSFAQLCTQRGGWMIYCSRRMIRRRRGRVRETMRFLNFAGETFLAVGSEENCAQFEHATVRGGFDADRRNARRADRRKEGTLGGDLGEGARVVEGGDRMLEFSRPADRCVRESLDRERTLAA